MAQPPRPDHQPRPGSAKADRAARLAEQLRANLHRRKAQARAIDAGDTGNGDPARAKTDLPKS